MSNLAPEWVYHRNLPHIQPPGATLFVTFRLAGSLPAEVAAALCAEADRTRAELELIPDSLVRAERISQEQRRFFGKWDAALDVSPGPNWLRNPAVAALLVENLHHFAGKRYDLTAYCIMPNHVHVVLTPLLKNDSEYYPLAQIMHTMKGYTAVRANRLLGRSGAFWQHESYDHGVRNEDELQRIVRYVLTNPVRAGLVADWQDWPQTFWAHEVDGGAATQTGGMCYGGQ
jgi:REP element-mobilizing transposase RayT